MSEMRDIKPNIRDEEAGPSQEPVTPRKPKGAKITLKVVNTNGERAFFDAKRGRAAHS